jgi:type VI secretion system protein ImpH
LLAPAVKSASRLEGMLAWMFKVDVSVEQFTGVWLPLDKAEQAALSKGNCSLGIDSIIGKSTFSLRDKFRVKLKVVNLAEFETFLPSGKNFRLMADAIEFYVGSMMIYDVAIGLPEPEAKPLQVGGFGRLGWTSWLTKKINQDPEITRWDCRFHPAELK